MSFLNRSLLFIYSLGIMALLFVLGLAAAGWTTPVNVLQTYLVGYNERIISGIVLVVYLIISIKFFLQSLSVERPPVQAVVQETELGQIRVSVGAVENLVARAIGQVNGVRDITPRVNCTPEGINIFLRVSLSPEVNIPQTSDEIQNKVKDYITEVAGLNIQSVKILVESISSEVKPGAPRKLN